MNAKKVPQIFVSSGAAKWNDRRIFRGPIGWAAELPGRGRIYAAYILKNYPARPIGCSTRTTISAGLCDRPAHEGPRSGRQADRRGGVLRNLIADGGFAGVQIKGANPDISSRRDGRNSRPGIKKISELAWHPVHFLTNCPCRSAAS